MNTWSDRVRPLRPEDLERLVTIDSVGGKLPRRRFFETRLAAGARHPDAYVHLGVEDGGVLVGFLMARIEPDDIAPGAQVGVFDALGVDPKRRDRGLGHVLVDALTAALRRHGVRKLLTQADWSNHSVLRFFESTGFRLAPRVVAERRVEPLFAPGTA